MKKVLCHVDMDCFFAACEIKKNPSLNGKKVIVGAAGNRGVVCSASYEARALGVHSAMPASKARTICPDGVFLPVDFACYEKDSFIVMSLLSWLCDDIMQVSIDEAYLDITTLSSKFTDLESAGRFIRDLIFSKAGLSCSVGISSSRVTAKIACNTKKPYGVTVVDDAKSFLAGLAIDKIPGIGKVSKKHYIENGINTIGDLSKLNRFLVLDKFGMSGIYFQDIANGKDNSTIFHDTSVKSISRENTFVRDITDKNALERVMLNLCHKVHVDLDEKSFKTISVKVRFSDFTTITRDVTLKARTRSFNDIKGSVMNLLNSCVDDNARIRLLGIRLSNLGDIEERQMTLGAY